MFSRKLVVDTAERALSTFAVTWLGAVTVLPGGIFSPANWQVALAGALAMTIKSLVSSKVGNPNTGSLLDMAPAAGGAVGGAAGAYAGGAVGSAVGSTVGRVTGAVGDLFTTIVHTIKGASS